MNEQEAQDLARADLAHIIHPQFHIREQQDAVIYERGEGALLYDIHGNEYIDGLASLWNVAVGHGRKWGQSCNTGEPDRVDLPGCVRESYSSDPICAHKKARARRAFLVRDREATAGRSPTRPSGRGRRSSVWLPPAFSPASGPW